MITQGSECIVLIAALSAAMHRRRDDRKLSHMCSGWTMILCSSVSVKLSTSSLYASDALEPAVSGLCAIAKHFLAFRIQIRRCSLGIPCVPPARIDGSKSRRVDMVSPCCVRRMAPGLCFHRQLATSSGLRRLRHPDLQGFRRNMSGSSRCNGRGRSLDCNGCGWTSWLLTWLWCWLVHAWFCLLESVRRIAVGFTTNLSDCTAWIFGRMTLSQHKQERTATQLPAWEGYSRLSSTLGYRNKYHV